MYHMTLVCIARHCKKYFDFVLIMQHPFLFSRQTLQTWLVTKIGGGQPSAVPVQCCLVIFSGWKCLRFPLSPVYTQLNFILMVSVPTLEMTCPCMFSRKVKLAWSDPLCLVLQTHDRRTLSIDLPTRITIPIFHRLRLNRFLRKRGNKVILELVCTQSGRTEQLSAPTEYVVTKDDVTSNIV